MISATITAHNNQTMDLTSRLNTFFKAQEKKAYAIAMMSLKNPDDAMDVVQDIMLKFVQKYKNYDEKVWCPLFYRMLQNRITDFHRKNTQQRKYFKIFYTEDSQDSLAIEKFADLSSVSSLQQIEQNLKIEQLQQALNKLPTRQLQAFICRIWEGLSVKETAKSMKCSQGSVKTHLFRALKSLKNEINTSDEVINHE